VPNRTFEQISSPCLGSFNAVSEEVVTLPKLLICDLVGNELLHRRPQLAKILQVLTNVVRLALHVECLGPWLIFRL
jgi:hypothetical protein